MHTLHEYKGRQFNFGGELVYSFMRTKKVYSRRPPEFVYQTMLKQTFYFLSEIALILIKNAGDPFMDGNGNYWPMAIVAGKSGDW